MNPDDIKLENLHKSLEYERFSRAIVKITDTDEIKNMARYFCKLYLKQQEAVASLAKLG